MLNFFLPVSRKKVNRLQSRLFTIFVLMPFFCFTPPELDLFALQELCSFILSLVMQQCITMLTCSYHQQWMDREQQQQQQKIVAASGKERTISQLLSNNVFPSSIFCFMAYTYIHTSKWRKVCTQVYLFGKSVWTFPRRRS